MGNSTYRWERFLNFIGRFLVHKTGLSIPDRPKDFVKPYSSPNFNRAEVYTSVYCLCSITDTDG